MIVIGDGAVGDEDKIVFLNEALSLQLESDIKRYRWFQMEDIQNAKNSFFNDLFGQIVL